MRENKAQRLGDMDEYAHGGGHSQASGASPANPTSPSGGGGGVGRPHLLLVTTDQQRRDTLGCYGTAAFTNGFSPNADRLAREGVRFTEVAPLLISFLCFLF